MVPAIGRHDRMKAAALNPLRPKQQVRLRYTQSEPATFKGGAYHIPPALELYVIRS